MIKPSDPDALVSLYSLSLDISSPRVTYISIALANNEYMDIYLVTLRGYSTGGNSRPTEFEVDGRSSKVEISQASLDKSEKLKNETNNMYYGHCNDHNIAMTTILPLSQQ